MSGGDLEAEVASPDAPPKVCPAWPFVDDASILGVEFGSIVVVAVELSSLGSNK